MKTITYEGKEYQLIRENVSLDSFINIATFMSTTTSGLIEVLDVVWMQYSTGLEVRLHDVHIFPSDFKTLLLAGMKSDPWSYRSVLEELKDLEACPRCNEVHELNVVEFSQIKYDGLCESCLKDEMYYAGIGECESCETITEVMEAKDAGVPVKGLYCDRCLVQMKEDLKERKVIA